MDQFNVNEMFYSLQGEGSTNGKPSIFVRLYGCPLRCTWCDTKHAYDNKSEMKNITFSDIEDLSEASNCKNIVFTGGEPMLQQKKIHKFINLHSTVDWSFEIETAGVIMPDEAFLNHFHINHNLKFNVSPKLSNSGVSSNKAIDFDIINALAGQKKSSFKFVISSDNDVTELQTLLDRTDIQDNQVWLMPEGVTKDDVLEKGEWLFNTAKHFGFNFTLRTHTILFGEQRGV